MPIDLTITGMEMQATTTMDMAQELILITVLLAGMSGWVIHSEILGACLTQGTV